MRLANLWLIALLPLLACLSSEAGTTKTQVTARVQLPDESLRAATAYLGISAFRNDGDKWLLASYVTAQKDRIRWPLDVPIVPASAQALRKEFEVIVDALGADGQRLAQARVVTAYEPNSLRVVDLWLYACPNSGACAEDVCHGVGCTTCGSAGECVPTAFIPPSSLPVYSASETPVLAGPDASGILGSDASEIPGPDASGIPSQPIAGDPDAGGAMCSTPDALRCSAMAGQRERCLGGVWTASESCAVSEVCTTRPNPGTCQAVATVCQGSAGQAVCDGQGVMYQCSAEGLATSQQTCTSAQHCQLGIAKGKCLTCLPNSYRCTSTQLERCDEAGAAYQPVKSCATAALCNASVGDCTDVACVANGYTCQGDLLRRCNATQTAYEDVKMCRPGLCDATNRQCDECTVGSKACEMDSVASCSMDGQMVTRTACAGTTPKCVGLGRCAQCAADTDCADPGVCKTRHCNLATGTCEPQNQPARAMCTGGLCDGMGNCGGCLQTSDCPSPGDCKKAFCNTTTRTCAPTNVASGTACTASTGFCNGTGSCAQCTSDAQCTAPVCRTARCSAGQCVVSVAATGSRDARCQSNYVCDSTSTCVECTATSQCDPLEACENGKCVPSCGNGKLDTAAGETCEVGLSGRDDWSCNKETCKLTGLTGSTLGKDCTNRSCSTGEVCDQNAYFGFPICLPSCGPSGTSSTCTVPPGWTALPCSGSVSPKGCIVQCQGGRCPNLSTCNMPGSGSGWCN